MKVCKPLKVPILTRVVEFRREPRLHVTAILGFPLASPRALVDELGFWQAVTPALGAATLDEGLAKSQGELLVAGRFCAPNGQPTAASFVRARVGATDKRLAVIGDRHWQRGVPTEPKPMVEMPIDWAHAYGGPGYDRNPLGIGIEMLERDGKSVRPLPNVEHYGDLMSSSTESPEPAGLGPMDWTFAQRRKRAGTFGSDYVDKYAPGLPPDHRPTVYNAAPEDQWIGQMWQGDEPILVENMNAEHRRIESALPNLLARAFVTHATAEGERFVEVALRCDTVWLLPTAGLGAVIFHGTLAVREDDGADIVHLVVGCEEPRSPRPLEHYRAALERRLDKDQGALGDLSDADLMPERGSGVVPNMDMGPMGQWVKSEMIGMANAHRGMERLRAERRAELVAAGLDPSAAGLDEPLAPPEPPPPVDDLDALAGYIASMEQRFAAEEAEGAVRAAELDGIRQSMRSDLGLGPELDDEPPARGEAPTFNARSELERYAELARTARAEGVPNLELEDKLDHPAFREELERLERMSRETYIQGAHLLPAPLPMTEQASELARLVMRAARDGEEGLAERDFTGADLHGVDLSGMDLRRSFFDSADLRGADLRRARLDGAVLARADLREANLEGASLVGANLGGARLEGAALTGADLTQVVLTGSRLHDATLARVTIAAGDLLDLAWEGVDLRCARLDQCSLVKADLTGANLAGASLVQTTFVECTLDRADFTEANLHRATFVSCRGENVRFDRALLSEAVLSHQVELPGADFRDARAERCCLRTASLARARFERARMSMADLSSADVSDAVFDQAILDRALLIRARLEGAKLRGVNLLEANLSKSRLRGADFTGAQLTRADFSRARGDRETRFTEAVVKFTRFDRDGAAVGGPA